VSTWTCRCKPRCQSLEDCHAPQRAEILCRECCIEPVSELGQVCAECLPETACPLCGSFACMDEECEEPGNPIDTAEEAAREV